ncbi:hypothetical protein ACIPWF_09735 [Paenarthrobacter sp. NPDC089989]|uniref:hypothetical protein n=1 Tax=unclassified Paenarthrobacter TaxID=2634190 RepID=UPI00380C31BA
MSVTVGLITKLTDMPESDMHFVEMWAQLFAAVGTVGALVAALAVFRHEYVERRRGDVRGVRAWVSPGSALGDAAKVDKEYPKGSVKNTSPEVIYNVKYAFRPISLIGADVRGAAEYLLPDASDETDCVGIESNRIAFEYPRLDVVFTDSRGTRWNRKPTGVLVVVKPFNRPWRIPHALDLADLPSWALLARWHYRWTTHAERRSFGLAPEWWAVDVRWSRWRYAQKHARIYIPWWKVSTRWKARHAIAQNRISQDLPLPLWIIDYRFRRKHELRAQEKAVKTLHKVERSSNGSTYNGR